MAGRMRLGVLTLAGLVAVKLVSDLSGLDALSGSFGLPFATAAEPEPEETEEPAEPEAEEDAGSEVPASETPPPPDPATIALPELLAAIAAERQALDERKAALDAREAEIALARAAVLKQNEELTQLREDVAALLDQAKSTEQADITRLVKIYEAMKPAEAAMILQDADLELAVLVIAAMAERNAGPIMAAMKPDRANAVARILLERSRLPGDQAPVVVQLN